jgi:hypothetical protein
MEPTSEPKIEPTPEPKMEPTPEPKMEPTPEPKMEPTPEPKMEPIPEQKMEPTPEPKMEPIPEPKMEPTPGPKMEPTPEPKMEPIPEQKIEPTPGPKIETKLEPKIKPKVEPKVEVNEDPVKRPVNMNDANSLKDSMKLGVREDLNKGSTQSTMDQIEGRVESSKPDKKLTYTEFQPPPDYEVFGRGLVYNCKGGHWACIDKSSYFKCIRNYIWSVESDKLPSCVKKGVYANLKDCQTAQKFHVNKLTEVRECK